MTPRAEIGLNAVIVAVTEEVPRILTVQMEGEEALPSGPLEPATDRTLKLAVRRWVREQTGMELGYVEQLYTFGDRNRDPAESHGGPRAVTVAYLALVRERETRSAGASWRGWYELLPWEDRRQGRPAVLAEVVAPALARWIDAAPDRHARQDRTERADIVFGLSGVAWDGGRVLERYELLYEAGLVPEAARDSARLGEASRPGAADAPARLGRPMALDHRRILATALGRLRGKLEYRPVVFELLPPSFTLLQLQRVVEALAGVPLHKQNFRRLVETAGLVEGTGRVHQQTGGRPAELFQFRREVLRERPAPGVALPGARRG